VPAARLVGDDNDAFGLDYAEPSAVQARRQLAAALLNAADELAKVLCRLHVG
jgi:hypothetical protein